MELPTEPPYQCLERVTDKKFVLFILNGYAELDGYHQLWRCVLIETCVDAIDYVEGRRMQPLANVDILKQAFTMVFESTLDFEYLCKWSLLEPDDVRTAVLNAVLGLKNFSAVLDRYRNDVPVFNETNMPLKDLEEQIDWCEVEGDED